MIKVHEGGKVAELFHEYDADGSGFLDRDEVMTQRYLEQAKREKEEEEARQAEEDRKVRPPLWAMGAVPRDRCGHPYGRGSA